MVTVMNLEEIKVTDMAAPQQTQLVKQIMIYRRIVDTTIQRIEGWWAQLRNSVTDWWIHLFKDMIQAGLFNPDNGIHRHCLAYVYAPLLQTSLDDFKKRWNSHRIRKNRIAGCPAGVPEDLYELPQLNGARSYQKSLDYNVWSYCYLEQAYSAPPFFPVEFKNLADSILAANNTVRADINVQNAEAIYI